MHHHPLALFFSAILLLFSAPFILAEQGPPTLLSISLIDTNCAAVRACFGDTPAINSTIATAQNLMDCAVTAVTAANGTPLSSSSCSAQIAVRASWEVTHYCVATDSVTIAGWGFGLPTYSARETVDLRNVSQVKYTSSLTPTTGPEEIFQGDQEPIRVVLRKDSEDLALKRVPEGESTEESAVSLCQLGMHGRGVGTHLLVIKDRDDAATPRRLGGGIVHVEFGSYHSKSVMFEIGAAVDAPTFGTEAEAGDPVVNGQHLFMEMIANATSISNNGILPPAMGDPKVEMSYIATLN